MKILLWQEGTLKLFGEVAYEHGFLTEDDIHRLLGIQVQTQQKIGEILVKMGKIEPGALDQLLLDYHEALSELEAM